MAIRASAAAQTVFLNNVNQILTNFNQLVFVDESHIDSRSVNRRYGRARRGERAIIPQVFYRDQRYSLIAALGVGWILDYTMVEGVYSSQNHPSLSCNPNQRFGEWN